jgi:NAD(P)-dependent dehydrogenase (short-subunit alcohol dehydrogenase family)
MTDSLMQKNKTLPGAIKPISGRLEGKIAVVTGGARGIGKGIANRFAQEGAIVLIADKDISRAEETVREIGTFGGKAEAYCADVSSLEDANAIIARSVENFDGIDILVNNAGIIEFGSILDCTPEDWNKMIAVDLTGAFYCTQAAARQMIRQGRGGRLVHIGSTASLFPAPFQAAYSVAKAGLLMLSRVAALEFIQEGITSNLLCPHGAVTDMNRNLLKDPSVMAKLEEHIPAGRLASVEEIAGAVAFLASDEAAYINGAEIIHDGGSSISSLWWR